MPRYFTILKLLVAWIATTNAFASSKPAQDATPIVPVVAVNPEKYIHNWISMPAFAAPLLPHDGEQLKITATPGRVLVLVFLASWCEPCQQRLPEILALEKKYSRINTDFVYVFAHDTPQDAEGFMQEFKIPQAVLASYEALKAYHNPELPSIYIGDRHGWLATRYLAMKAEDIEKLDYFLQYLTGY